MRLSRYSDFKAVNEEENLWGDIKYGFSKLGRYKAGGKIFGKGETDKEAAYEMGEIMGDTANAVIKATHDLVMKAAPEFPNDRKRIAFLRGIILYGQLYDSIVAAAEKKPGEEGYLSHEVANKLIENLRKVVKKALDVDLAAVYSVMDSKDSIDVESEDMLFEEIFFLDDEPINEEFLKKLKAWKDKAMDKMFGKEDEDSEQRIAGSRQSAKLQGAGDDGEVESERMKTLASNKLPMVLMGIGGALGALGWIASTDWFKDLVTDTVYHPAKWGTMEESVKKNLVQNPKGWSYTIQDNGFKAATGKSLAFDQPASNLKDAFNFYGGGNEQKGVEAMSQFLGGENRAASAAEVTRQLADPSNKTILDIFNKLEGTWGDNFFMNQTGGAKIASIVTKTTRKYLIKAGFKTTTTSLIGGKLIALAPVLGAMGIALIAAGATVKLLREKGKRQSRAKTLNDLLQSLKLVKAEDSGKEEGGAQGQGEGEKENSKVDEKSIYPLMIKNLQALKSMLITYEGVSLEGESGSGNVDRKIKVGKEYIYTNKKGDKKKVKVVSISHDVRIGADRKWATEDDVNAEKLDPGVISVVAKDKKGEYSPSSPNFAVNTDQLAPVKESLLLEKEFTKGPRNSEVTKSEDYLTQAVTNVRKSIKSMLDEKDKGVAITPDFVQEILDVKMASDSKETIKKLYKEIYEFLYGKYSKTLPDYGPLYKESMKYLLPKSATNPDGGKMPVVAEKIARLSKKTLQFEGEGFYSGLGEFGEDLQDFNSTLKDIMEFYKSSSSVKESRISSFKGFKY